MESAKEITTNNKPSLGYRERDKLYKKEYSSLKIKIVLNCFELFALFSVLAIVSYLLLTLLEWNDFLIPITISIAVSLMFTGIFYKIKKYQISITRFDKEGIYKKISKDLLNNKC